MLSIIICSIKPKYLSDITENIKKTIGCTYEILAIDNNIEKLTITQAYNKGAKEAKYPNLLFVHEDVIFHTLDWGKILTQRLSNKEIGIIGVAGSAYVPHAPSGFTNQKSHYNFHNLLAHIDQKLTHIVKPNPEGLKMYALDGVFLAMREEVYEEIKFNESLPGFHSYDLDITLRSSIKYRNEVTYDILIQHLSNGSPNTQWLLNNIAVKRYVKVTNPSIDSENECYCYSAFLQEMKKNNYSKIEYLKLGIEFFPFFKLNLRHTIRCVQFLLTHL
jgi:hypothetical protein